MFCSPLAERETEGEKNVWRGRGGGGKAREGKACQKKRRRVAARDKQEIREEIAPCASSSSRQEEKEERRRWGRCGRRGGGVTKSPPYKRLTARIHREKGGGRGNRERDQKGGGGERVLKCTAKIRKKGEERNPTRATKAERERERERFTPLPQRQKRGEDGGEGGEGGGGQAPPFKREDGKEKGRGDCRLWWVLLAWVLRQGGSGSGRGRPASSPRAPSGPKCWCAERTPRPSRPGCSSGTAWRSGSCPCRSAPRRPRRRSP